ncbi:hypothetical protein JN531_012070 [Flagellatimonas centrodinii]|uniref:hypothetical protein n=1 Tax=Flagellatimonas centrodinii TaxID=2806210 RepID=UPI001FED391B|nr:hypothetical protein [Flagellatimonas centrodinii]ULQ45836.1 hypothetical protein JN531_012070 [Flagellatimonas centrodinii]
MSKKPTPAPWNADTHEPVRGSTGGVRHRVTGEHNGDKIIGMTETDYLHALKCVNRCAELAKPAPVAVPDLTWQDIRLEIGEVSRGSWDGAETITFKADALLRFINSKRREAMIAAAPQPPAPAVDVEAVRSVSESLRTILHEDHPLLVELVRAIGDET